MFTFKDNANREWSIAIDAPKIMRIRDECDPRFLLNDSDDENTFDRLNADPVLLCRVVYLLCDQQRQAAGIDEESFYSQVIGDAIDRATDAMLKAILAFTRGRARTLLETVAQKQENVQRILAEKALAHLNNPELEATVIKEAEARLDALFGSYLTPPLSATDSLDSSASASSV